MRALVVGYFSTVGDLEVLRHVTARLDHAGVPYDAGAFDPRVSRQIAGAVDVHAVDPRRYSHLCLVCGPLNRDFLVSSRFDLDRFAHCTRIGVNLTTVRPLADYDPLDALVGRDSDAWARPDLSLVEDVGRVPVVGLCLARSQAEYGARVRHDEGADLLRRAARRRGTAVVELDTEWPRAHNRTGLGSPEEFESLCARLDVMLTTRLHGLVLALKNGVPAVALDAIAGGAKVSRQAAALGWSEIFVVGSVGDGELDAALDRCLQPAARDLARSCAARARAELARFPDELAAALAAPPQARPADTAPPGPSWLARTARRAAAGAGRLGGRVANRAARAMS